MTNKRGVATIRPAGRNIHPVRMFMRVHRNHAFMNVRKGLQTHSGSGSYDYEGVRDLFESLLPDKRRFRPFSKAVCLLALCSGLALPAQAQDKDWIQLSGDGLAVFMEPWLAADRNQSAVSPDGVSKPVPPLQTVNFEECDQYLSSRRTDIMPDFEMLDAWGEAFAASIPLSLQAKADAHILRHGSEFIAFFENRALKAPPETRIYESVVGQQYANGAISILAKGSTAYQEVDGKYEVRPVEDFSDHMVLRRVREADGKDYIQLFRHVAADGTVTKDTKLYYSCMKLPKS